MNTCTTKLSLKPLALAAALFLSLGAAAAPASAESTLAAPKAASPVTSDFEGRIDMKVSSAVLKESNADLNIYIKMPKMRVEMNASLDMGDKAAKSRKKAANPFAMVIIADSVTEENIILMPQQKMYMVTKGNKGTNNVHNTNEDAFKPTGRTQTILGYRAEEWASTGSGEYTEMWLATGLGTFHMAGADPKQKQGSWETFLKNKGFFPLKVTAYRKKGDTRILNQMEVTKIERGSQPASLFVPPADYKRLDMGGMLDANGN